MSEPAAIEPRPSASIVLVRDGADGLEVFVQRRASTMAFAPGVTVFPGGGMSVADTDASVPWAGPAPAWWAEKFGVDEETARGLVCAAVRETFEESGVLLASTAGAEPSGERYPDARDALASGAISLAEFLRSEGLVVRADLLRPWANWITPAGEKRRYNTRFFAAALPAGQQADGKTTEAVETGWYRPAALIDIWARGEAVLMPPTWAQLDALLGLDFIESAMTLTRNVTPIAPRWVDGRLDFPDSARYLAVVSKIRG